MPPGGYIKCGAPSRAVAGGVGGGKPRPLSRGVFRLVYPMWRRVVRCVSAPRPAGRKLRKSRITPKKFPQAAHKIPVFPLQRFDQYFPPDGASMKGV